MNYSKKSIWLTLVIVLPSFMMGLDLLIMGVTLAPIAKSLKIHVAVLQWLMTAYAIGVASFYVMGGKLCDIYSPKSVCLLGVALFSLSSFAISFSNSAYMVIAMRFTQGVGAAFSVSGVLALIMELYKPTERSKPMGGVVSSTGLGMALAPILGGFLIHHFGWRSVFLINVPVGVITFMIGIFCLPTKTTHIKRRIDLIGALLLIVTVMLLSTALSQSSVWGWGDRRTWAFLLSSVLLSVVLVYVEKRIEKPLVDFELLKIKNFLAGSFMGYFAYFMLIGWVLVFGLYLQHALLLSPLNAGFLLIPFSLGFFIAAWFAGFLATRILKSLVVLIGYVFYIIGLLFFPFMTPLDSYAVIIIGSFLFAVGFAFINTGSMPLALTHVPQDKAGIAAGKTMTIRWLGGATGSALSAMLFKLVANHYSAQVVGYTHGMHATMWLFVGLGCVGFLLSLTTCFSR